MLRTPVWLDGQRPGHAGLGFLSCPVPHPSRLAHHAQPTPAKPSREPSWSERRGEVRSAVGHPPIQEASHPDPHESAQSESVCSDCFSCRTSLEVCISAADSDGYVLLCYVAKHIPSCPPSVASPHRISQPANPPLGSLGLEFFLPRDAGSRFFSGAPTADYPRWGMALSVRQPRLPERAMYSPHD